MDIICSKAMSLGQIQDISASIYESLSNRSELKTFGIILLSGFFGAATCMAMQSLISLDEVELKEKKSKKMEDEKEKEKLVHVCFLLRFAIFFAYM
jgi:hypothetical protein